MADMSRLEEAADKVELYELVVAYCRAMDRRDVDLMRTLYHPDAIDDHGSLFDGTGEEFINFLPGPITVFAITTHHTTNATSTAIVRKGRAITSSDTSRGKRHHATCW